MKKLLPYIRGTTYEYVTQIEQFLKKNSWYRQPDTSGLNPNTKKLPKLWRDLPLHTHELY